MARLTLTRGLSATFVFGLSLQSLPAFGQASYELRLGSAENTVNGRIEVPLTLSTNVHVQAVQVVFDWDAGAGAGVTLAVDPAISDRADFVHVDLNPDWIALGITSVTSPLTGANLRLATVVVSCGPDPMSTETPLVFRDGIHRAAAASPLLSNTVSVDGTSVRREGGLVLINGGFRCAELSSTSLPRLVGPAVRLSEGVSHAPVVSDGAGGALVVWADASAFGNGGASLYAQHWSTAGQVDWTLPLDARALQVGNQFYDLSMTSDGDGGAIITWSAGRSNPPFDVYAQRITRAGEILWSPGGVLLGRDAWYPAPAPDGNGGAIIIWNSRTGTDLNTFVIRAQRVRADGRALWAAEGVAVPESATSEGFGYKAVIADGSGGALLAWNTTSGGDIYAQRIDAAGRILWNDAAPISRAQGTQFLPQLVSDGAGGAIVAWHDGRRAIGASDVYAQRVNASGRTLWAPDGISVTPSSGLQSWWRMIADGAGGAILAWTHHDEPALPRDGFAQRLNGAGQLLWGPSGVPIGVEDGNQCCPDLINDGAGGAFIVWSDARPAGNGRDIFAQWLDPDGRPRWEASGLAVSEREGDQTAPRVVLSGQANDELLVFWDDFAGPSAGCCRPDLFAQRVRFRGVLFHRGDPNGSGTTDLSDAIMIFNWLFLGGPEPSCLESANVNDDSAVDISDGIGLLNFLFSGGSRPPAPGPAGDPCGADPLGSSADLGCVSYTGC